MSLVQSTYDLYFWTPIVCCPIGILGNLLNISIFLSIKTCRQSPSTYYIVCQSICDIISLIVCLLTADIPSIAYPTSSFGCKLNCYTGVVSVSWSMYFICLAAFDRWASTARSARIRRLSSIRVARILCPITFCLWLFIHTPWLIYCDFIPSDSVCWYTNELFQKVFYVILAPVLICIIPALFLIVISVLTYQNIHRLTHNRQEGIRNQQSTWEHQITILIFIQNLLVILFTLPRALFMSYMTVTDAEGNNNSFDEIVTAAFVDALTNFIMTLNLTTSFYVYIISSSRIRHIISTYLKNLFNIRPGRIEQATTSHQIFQLTESRFTKNKTKQCIER